MEKLFKSEELQFDKLLEVISFPKIILKKCLFYKIIKLFDVLHST